MLSIFLVFFCIATASACNEHYETCKADWSFRVCWRVWCSEAGLQDYQEEQGGGEVAASPAATAKSTISGSSEYAADSEPWECGPDYERCMSYCGAGYSEKRRAFCHFDVCFEPFCHPAMGKSSSGEMSDSSFRGTVSTGEGFSVVEASPSYLSAVDRDAHPGTAAVSSVAADLVLPAWRPELVERAAVHPEGEGSPSPAGWLATTVIEAVGLDPANLVKKGLGLLGINNIFGSQMSEISRKLDQVLQELKNISDAINDLPEAVRRVVQEEMIKNYWAELEGKLWSVQDMIDSADGRAEQYDEGLDEACQTHVFGYSADLNTLASLVLSNEDAIIQGLEMSAHLVEKKFVALMNGIVARLALQTEVCYLLGEKHGYPKAGVISPAVREATQSALARFRESYRHILYRAVEWTGSCIERVIRDRKDWRDVSENTLKKLYELNPQLRFAVLLFRSSKGTIFDGRGDWGYAGQIDTNGLRERWAYSVVEHRERFVLEPYTRDPPNKREENVDQDGSFSQWGPSGDLSNWGVHVMYIGWRHRRGNDRARTPENLKQDELRNHALSVMTHNTWGREVVPALTSGDMKVQDMVYILGLEQHAKLHWSAYLHSYYYDFAHRKERVLNKWCMYRL